MKKRTTLFAALITLISCGQSFAGDWPNYLGPNHNGMVEEGSLRLDWKSEPPQTAWTRNVGAGCSSFAIADGKALTIGNQNEKDTVWCFDALSGEVIWKHVYSEPLHDLYYTGGSSSTPTIDEDRLYTISKSGKLFCLKLDSGDVIWEKDYSVDFDGRQSKWGWGASPLVYGDQLIIDPGSRSGSIAALDKHTGDLLWKTGDSKPGYSTPSLIKIDGKNALAYFHSNELAVYDLDDPNKKELFSFPWRTNYGVNATNLQYLDGKMFLGSGYGSGYAIIDVTKLEPEIVHRDRSQQLQLQSNLLIDDRIIAVFGDEKKSNGTLASLDLSSGKTDWQQSLPGGTGNVIAIGDHFIVTTESGHVILAKIDKKGFTELGRLQPVLGTAWALPSFANGRLYFRNNLGKAVCLDVSQG